MASKRAQLDELEAQLDTLEDEGKGEPHPEWMKVWRESVKIQAKMYQEAFPNSKIQFNAEGTQFKVL